MMSKFQLLLLLGLGMVIVLAVLIFAGYLGGTRPGELPTGGPVTIWGPFRTDQMNQVIDQFNLQHPKVAEITYVEKDSRRFERDLVEALARGAGPDVLFFPEDLLGRQSDKLMPVPFGNLSERAFRDAYVDGANYFVSNTGAYGLPSVVDPLILYYNKTILSGAGFAKTPTYWDELIPIAKKLSQKDTKGNFIQSTIALGAYGNISHAKEILASLFLQVGEPISAPPSAGQDSSGNFAITLGNQTAQNIAPADSALRFYSDFGNPSRETHSWSSSLPNSRDVFLAGKLAFYIGYASEFDELRAANPHLDFDVALLPQIRPPQGSAGIKAEFAKIYALSVLKTAPNFGTAFTLASYMNDPQFNKFLAGTVRLPSARRDVISAGSADPNLELFSRAAIIAKSWLDPDPEESNLAFQEMVELVSSGALSEHSAILGAAERLRNSVQR